MGILSTHSEAQDPQRIVEDLAAGIGPSADPALVTFFCGHQLDGGGISEQLRRQYPAAEVVGCTTAGEFSGGHNGIGSTVALAFPRSIAPRVASSLARFDRAGATQGVAEAVAAIEQDLGSPLRDLDADRHVGMVLVDGLHGREEEVNRALGVAAPYLSFVGGSAGDNLEFETTRVFRNGEASDDGAALVLLELSAPFTILKTCSFVPSGRTFTVTKADTISRTVQELDGRPVLDAYAEAVGRSPGELDSSVFMKHPLGVMIEGEPWIRSPQQVTPEKELRFYCQIPEGMQVDVMNSTDLIGDTRKAMESARAKLGGRISGALLFNCILRRLELDETGQHREFLATFEDVPMAGFHTYGESWLGHINQTCTGILIG